MRPRATGLLNFSNILVNPKNIDTSFSIVNWIDLNNQGHEMILYNSPAIQLVLFSHDRFIVLVFRLTSSIVCKMDNIFT